MLAVVTPETFAVEHVPTPLGEMLVLCDGDGFLRAVDWKDCEPRLRELLRRQYGAGAVTLVEARAPSTARRGLERYLAGELAAIEPL
jgi:methylated-DNA-[protein]-cysteine S-methyltransferase